MAYITGDREQRVLLPSCVEEFIGPEDPVRAYDAFVEQLDLARLGITTVPDRAGHPEFDPRAMLKLLVYGYSYGIRSSRKLERATHHNLSFIWLMGGLKPDHKTIARFRRNQREALKNVLKQCAQVCVKLGLVTGNTLFVDGTKIRANASMKHTWTEKRCSELLGNIEDRIESILAECDTADNQEANHPPAIKLKDQLRAQEDLKSEIQTILSALQEEERSAINTTDPDAGRMRNGGQVEVSYNCQSVVDDKHGLIIYSDVINASNDLGQFSKPIDEAQKTLDIPCQTACADAGYSSPNDLQTIMEQGVDVVVPILYHSDFRDRFAYDATNDLYTCSEGHQLRYTGNHKNNNTRIYSITNAKFCHSCPQFGQCTKSAQGRRVERPFTEPVRELLERRYERPDARALMRRRKLRSELPFGHIKHNLGMRTFLLRGLSGANAEFSLAATAFNLRRMLSLRGVNEMLRQMAPCPG